MTNTNHSNVISSGFIGLDQVTTGFHSGNLIVFGGQASMDKTDLILNIVRNIAVKENCPVGYFSLEMPTTQLTRRMMVLETGLNYETIRNLKNWEPNEIVHFEKILKPLKDSPLWFIDTPFLSISEFKSNAHKLVQNHGVKVIVVDYLQLMRNQEIKYETREEEMFDIAKTLKDIAKELNVPIIVISQRKKDSGIRPQSNDLCEPTAITVIADVVILIHRQDEHSDSHVSSQLAEIRVVKNNNGTVGDIKMQFDSAKVRFCDID